jgi:hypothetical protein
MTRLRSSSPALVYVAHPVSSAGDLIAWSFGTEHWRPSVRCLGHRRIDNNHLLTNYVILAFPAAESFESLMGNHQIAAALPPTGEMSHRIRHLRPLGASVCSNIDSP